MTELTAQLITGALTLVGVIITNATANRRLVAQIQTAQAVTDAKLENLTREVRQHNDFARRIPVMEEQIRELHHRISHVEREVNKG